jgi:hypothetical protein
MLPFEYRACQALNSCWALILRKVQRGKEMRNCMSWTHKAWALPAKKSVSILSLECNKFYFF